MVSVPVCIETERGGTIYVFFERGKYLWLAKLRRLTIHL